MSTSLAAINASISVSPRQATSFTVNTVTSEYLTENITSIAKSLNVRLVIMIGMGDWKRDLFLRDLKNKSSKDIVVCGVDPPFNPIMMTDSKYTFDASKLTMSHVACQGKVKTCLSQTFNNQLIFVANRNTVLEHIKMYSNMGKFIVICFAPVSKEVSLKYGLETQWNIPLKIFSDAYDELKSLQLNSSDLPNLKAIYRVKVE